MIDLDKALAFAAFAHSGQKRRYDAEPYITHPEAVARIVASVVHTPEMFAAAYLHDVVEDTAVGIETIGEFFGPEIAGLVWWLSDPELDGNRAIRKASIRTRWMRAPRAAKTIKMADIIHNSTSIFEHDPKFGLVYAEEAWQLLDAIRDGSQELLVRARSQIREFRASLVLTEAA
jgi:guanosine-3',5'-bis(diphosphate) 3'-pyrophosphohydrolase